MIICISETYLDSSVPTDGRDILINGCNLIWADHSSNNKRGGVCIYHWESLAVELVETNYLSEGLLCEVSINNKKCYVAVLYKSPSQNSSKFDNFILILKWCLVILILLILISLSFLVILMWRQIIGDKVILKQVKDLELIISQLLMVSNN